MYNSFSVSVCLATFNGERFIAEQLESILISQIVDEVLIIDDSSSDATLSIVARYTDARIRVIRHCENKGVISTFNELLQEASGDIIFLSDQDDIWINDKVKIHWTKR